MEPVSSSESQICKVIFQFLSYKELFFQMWKIYVIVKHAEHAIDGSSDMMILQLRTGY
jgi:hypothetical protein